MPQDGEKAIAYIGLINMMDLDQSNWQTWEDFGSPKKKLGSRILKRLKRFLKYLQFKLKTF
jgi:hypothetical protein